MADGTNSTLSYSHEGTGPDTPITRANIGTTQARQAARGKPLYSADQIAGLFVTQPAQRHYHRARRLM